MCTYKSLTREEAHKTNQVHEEQIKKTRKKICQSYHFDNRLLLLAFHCSHLDEDLLYCQVYNEWLVHLCIKDLLFPQWVRYIMNRLNLQHVRSKVPLRLCWIFHSAFTQQVHVCASIYISRVRVWRADSQFGQPGTTALSMNMVLSLSCNTDMPHLLRVFPGTPVNSCTGEWRFPLSFPHLNLTTLILGPSRILP